MEPYIRAYDIPLLDDIHNYFPDLLYNNRNFLTLTDIFSYVNRQMDINFNHYNRAMRNYSNRTQPVPQPPTVSRNTTVYSMTVPVVRQDLIDLLMSYLPNPMPNMEPVVVSPTREQITNSTELSIALSADEQNSCSICQENYTDGQSIRKINHCSHEFHKNCIDIWFLENVHCPVCRYDIRENLNQNVA
jgi:hypothetical protein